MNDVPSGRPHPLAPSKRASSWRRASALLLLFAALVGNADARAGETGVRQAAQQEKKTRPSRATERPGLAPEGASVKVLDAASLRPAQQNTGEQPGALHALSTAGHSSAVERTSWIDTAKVTSSSANTVRSANQTAIVTFTKADGTTARGVFKPKEGEAKGLRANVPAGTYFLREQAVSRLNDALGLTLVPHTVVREINGKIGSVQEFEEHTVPQGAQFDRAQGEQFKVFDYLTGNSDRHDGNFLIRQDESGGLHPVAIDNGLALPNGVNTMWRFPTQFMNSHHGALLPETRQFIDGIDEANVAHILAVSGIEREAIVHVLRRIEHLKRDPSFLEQEREFQVDAEGKVVDQHLTIPELEHIDRIVDLAQLASASH